MRESDRNNKGTLQSYRVSVTAGVELGDLLPVAILC